MLDLLLEQSSTSLAAYDDLIATLYAPQKPSTILLAVASLVAQVHGTSRPILQIVPSPSLEVHMGSLEVSSSSKDGKTGGKPKDIRKWFETCFAQIEKMSLSIEKDLT